jgi:hypothetical protein
MRVRLNLRTIIQEEAEECGTLRNARTAAETHISKKR